MTDLEYPAPRERMKAASWGVLPVALALASVVGLATLFMRREDHTMRMGPAGVAWFAIAVLIVVIWEAVS